MLRIHLKVLVLLAIMVVFMAPPCFAKADGYCYVVAYSFREKVAFFTPVFVKKVRNISYSADEFVAEVELIQKMESAFESHVRRRLKFSPADLTVSARAAYKSSAIAKRRKNAEKEEYSKKAFEVKEASNFKF